MKLIIEIPDEAFEAYKYWEENKVATVEQTLIAHGIPYNPTGDILHKIPKDFVYDTETPEFYCYRNKYTGKEIHIIKSPKTYVLERPQGEYDCNSVLKAIDNAPTVSDRYDEGYAQGYVDGSTGADWKGGAE